MQVGIGFEDTDVLSGFDAGASVAQQALEKFSGCKPALALVFCGDLLNEEQLLEGIRSLLGKEISIVGGVTIGVITNQDLSYSGHHVGLCLLEGPDIGYELAVSGGVDNDGFNAGLHLARELEVDPLNELMF